MRFVDFVIQAEGVKGAWEKSVGLLNTSVSSTSFAFQYALLHPPQWGTHLQKVQENIKNSPPVRPTWK